MKKIDVEDVGYVFAACLILGPIITASIYVTILFLRETYLVLRGK